MKERTKFVLEWERRWNEAEGGSVQMAELCRMFGISRQTGYTWVRRYRDAHHKLEALAERSRRPKTSPNALSAELEDVIVQARKRWPKWGPRKLRKRLVELYPGMAVPSASVMSKVLKKRGLSEPRKRRRRVVAIGIESPFSGCNAANAVWCIDFKGWFLTGDGQRCYPLTLLDAFSRYLLRCEALRDPNGAQVRRVLDSAFLEFGLPLAIRSDGGPPFASSGPARLTELSVWLLQLGIRVEIIAPGKPQQNGRLERLHRTLKADTATPAERDLPSQQRCFDVWRREYNHERPHEALEMRRPATVYDLSPRKYPRPLVKTDFDPFTEVARIDKHGFIKWHRRKLFISSALKHEYLELRPLRDVGWTVHWGPITLGRLDEYRLDRGLVVARRHRGNGGISGMSLLEV